MAALTRWEKFQIFFMVYIVSIICMPLFGIVKPILVLIDWIRDCFRRSNNPERHAKKVKYIQKQVLDWNKSGRKTMMCSARPGWQTLSTRIPIYKETLTGIDVNIGDMVELNPEKMTVTIEPMMNMGRLTSIMVPMGWTIPVVPELNDLTIGGLLCGAGLETSSHKYGLINNITLSVEIVLASGEVVICSKDKNTELFYAIPGSCGTLGFVTAVELMMIPAKKFVKLEYMPVHSLDEAISTFEAQTYRKEGNEFVEGFMYSLDKGVIMVGNMVSEAETGKINSVARWYKPWFYKHAETFLKKNAAKEFVEYIPLRDYYHRHTQGLFWEVANVIPYANNVIFRYLLGWILPLRVYLIKLATPDFFKKVFDKNHVVQDFVVPMEKLRESLVLTHEEFQIYPIWLCPCKLINEPGAIRFKGDEDEMYVDFGIYGVTKLKKYDLVKAARIMEMYCIKNRGYQALYSDICMTKEEFAEMFDPRHYLKVREDLKCLDAFPDIYDKVSRAARR